MRYEGPACFQERIETEYRRLREGYLHRPEEPTIVVGQIGTLHASPFEVRGDHEQSARIDALHARYAQAPARRREAALRSLAAATEKADILPKDADFAYFPSVEACVYSPRGFLGLELLQRGGATQFQIASDVVRSVAEYERGMIAQPLLSWELAGTRPFRDLVARFAGTEVVFDAKRHGAFSGTAFRRRLLEKVEAGENIARISALVGQFGFLGYFHFNEFVQDAAGALVAALAPNRFPERTQDRRKQALYLRAEFEQESFMAFAKQALERAYAERCDPAELI